MQQLRLLSLLLIFVTQLNFTAQSQSYQPMAVEGATWIMGGYGDWESLAWAFRISGDTIVNNVNYKKLFHYDLELVVPASGPHFYVKKSKDLAVLIRDDTLARKVYVYPFASGFPGFDPAITCDTLYALSTNEMLLFDFSQTVGDTLSECMLDESFDGQKEIKFDTTLYLYDDFRRALVINDNIQNVHKQVLIEGVGFTSGLFNTHSLFISAAKGVGLGSHCIGPEEFCKLQTSSTDESLEDGRFNLFPNPVADILQIETEEKIVEGYILDLNGRKVLPPRFFTSSLQKSIDVSGLSQGIYLVQLVRENKPPYVSKFVKL